MLLRNIYVYETGQAQRELKNVVVQEGRKAVLPLDADLAKLEVDKIIDAGGRYTLMPGMLDSHVHGQDGIDFAEVGDFPEGKGVAAITEALGKTGLSYAMATLISLDLSSLEKSLNAIDAYVMKQEKQPFWGCTKIVGVHLEGPFIAKACKGSHAESALQDRIDMKIFKKIIDAAPHVKQWKITLAPDLPGALDFINEVKKLEAEDIFVKVFIGHSNPEEKADIDKAVAAGAMGFTHLGNACQESCCKEARHLEISDAKSHVVQWVLENPDKCPPGVELIVDGKHVSPSFVLLVKKCIGDKIILVTDALGPSGLKDGLYKLGPVPIRKDGRNFYLADEKGGFKMKIGKLPNGETGEVKALAGSAVPLSFCAQTYFNWLKTETSTFADRMDASYAALVTNPRITSLSPAAVANLPEDNNFVIFNKQGRLVMSLCNGRLREHQWELVRQRAEKRVPFLKFSITLPHSKERDETDESKAQVDFKL